MNRIHNLLHKAERDGTVRRTRALIDDEPRVNSSRGDTAAAVLPPPAAKFPDPIVVEPVVAPAPYAPAPAAPQVAFDPRLIAALAPASLAAEQYRSLRARIKRAEGNRVLRSIAVTSPAKGDGKSLTSANLALTMAQEFHQRVLLVDGDLRRPCLHRLFGFEPRPGLSDVLMGGAELQDVMISIPDQQLTLLPAGSPPAHPTELLGSATMQRIFDTLRREHDRIIIDMPPVAPLADLQVVAPLVDGLLLIVRAGVTQKPAIERALSGLDLNKVLGLVLNASDAPGVEDRYATYGYIA